MKRKYVCNKYKNYSIRNHYFHNGMFETDDPQVQALIESADGYGVFIHPCETKEEIAAMRAKEREARRAAVLRETMPEEEQPRAIAHQGARGSLASKAERGLMVIKAK